MHTSDESYDLDTVLAQMQTLTNSIKEINLTIKKKEQLYREGGMTKEALAEWRERASIRIQARVAIRNDLRSYFRECIAEIQECFDECDDESEDNKWEQQEIDFTNEAKTKKQLHQKGMIVEENFAEWEKYSPQRIKAKIARREKFKEHEREFRDFEKEESDDEFR